MSNMLEQAIIDAAALREAALKNAEQSIIEKYAPKIKKAVEAMLEDESINENRTKMYQGRTVQVIHEADEEGNLTVSENNGKPFMVNESELSEATDEDVLQEEEMTAAADTTTPPPEIVAPPAWDSRRGEQEKVTLTGLMNNLPDNEPIHIDLDHIELSLSQREEAETTSLEDDSALTDPLGDLGGGEDLGGEEEGLDDLLGGLEDEDEGMLQELLDLLSEYDDEILEEEIEVDMGESKDGTFQTFEPTLRYEADKQEAHEAHTPDEEELLEEEEDELTEAIARALQTQQNIEILKQQNQKLESVVHKLNDKLEETLLSNAKLLYQNRTLNDASLNERQKTKIVEAIAKAESPKEAKSLHETLRATVGSDQKKAPQSLNETVNRRSNLSSMLNTRQNINESKSTDPFLEKMQKLAGIK